MACSCTRPNYKGPGVGIWALALSLEFSVGVLMIFMGAQSIDLTQSIQGMHFDQKITDAISNGSAWKVVNVFGWLHLLVASACGAFVTLGLFVCGIFLCPLCIMGWVQCAFCVISTFVTAAYLREYLNTLPSFTGSGLAVKTGGIFFAQLNSGGLLAASVLSFTAAVVLSRASRASSGDSVPGTALMVYSMGLFAAIGALIGVGGGGRAPTPTLAALWVCLTAVGAVLMNIRNCFRTKACNVLMIVLFGAGAALSVITAAIMGSIYTNLFQNPTEELISLYAVMERGTGIVVTAGLAMASTVMSSMATIYSARSLICCGPGVSHS